VDNEIATISLSGRTVDLMRHVIRQGDASLGLTPMETKLLGYLAQRLGTAVSADELLREVWGYNPGVVSRAVHYTVRRLRPKIEDDPAAPRHLVTVYAYGYALEEASVTHTDVEPASPDLPPRLLDSNLSRPSAGLIDRPVLVNLVDQHIAAGARLVSLVGPAGMGKTTVAVMAGHALMERMPVWFVDLSETRTAPQVADAIASVSMEPHHCPIPDGEALWILDNLEQLEDTSIEALARWMDDAPSAHVLVTSRRLCRLVGERSVEVQPLEPVQAEELFRIRAKGVCPTFDASSSHVSELAQRLDGIPLAIEFAAARANLLGIEEMIERSGDRFRNLSRGTRGPHGRHESLQVAIDWSWKLLNPPLQSAMCQCTVFRGGFDLSAAEAIIDLGDFDGIDVFQAVQELRDSSLLRASADAQRRLDMLATLREYAVQKAQDVVDLHAARERHCVYFATRLQDRSPSASVHADFDNLIAAHKWACERNAHLAIGLLRAAWDAGLLHATAQDLYSSTVAIAQGMETLSQSERAVVEICRATQAYRRGDREDALALAAVAERRAQDARDVVLATGTHRFQASVLMDLGRPTEALEHLRVAIEALAEQHKPATEGEVRRIYAGLLLDLGRHAEAEDALDAADGIHSGDGLRSRLIRASLRLDQGRLAEALIGYQAVSQRARSRGRRMLAARTATDTARVLASIGRMEDAVDLLNNTRKAWRGSKKMLTLFACQQALIEALRGRMADAEDWAVEGRALLNETAYPGQHHILDLATVARAATRAVQISEHGGSSASLVEAMALLDTVPESTWLGLRVYGRLVRRHVHEAAREIGL